MLVWLSVTIACSSFHSGSWWRSAGRAKALSARYRSWSPRGFTFQRICNTHSQVLTLTTEIAVPNRTVLAAVLCPRWYMLANK